MKQYLDLCQRVVDEGVWVENKRTGKRCKTVINADFEYDVSEGKLPLVTTRKSFYKAAIMEMTGYLRGYQSAKQFRDIGCPTWSANANENESWLNNPYREGEDDIGRAYGVQLRDYRNFKGESFDQLTAVYNDLKQGIDNRSEIITFLNPAERHMACLNACMHTHTFSVLDGGLYLTSYQRSIDIPLGLNFNMVQVAWLLMIMAQITGLKPMRAYHKLINCHIYEDQYELMRDVQLKRDPFESPTLKMSPDIKSLDDVLTWMSKDDFTVEGYRYHPAIEYPFSV